MMMFISAEENDTADLLKRLLTQICMHQRSRSGRECPPGPGQDFEIKFLEPGSRAGHGHIINFYGPGLPGPKFCWPGLAGSRAGSIILPGTWKIPDISAVQHI